MNDNYSHDSFSIIYITESIPGPPTNDTEFEDIENNFNSQITHHCSCNQFCEPEKCPCLLKSGTYTSRPEENQFYFLNIDEVLNNSYPIYECNNLCHCSYKCKNRNVQKGPIEGLYTDKCVTEAKGLGLYARNFVPKGTFVCEYAGEIITKSQAVSRYSINQAESKMNYIFCLQEFSNGNVIRTFVDPTYLGNIGRYINHSCDANCVILPVRVNSPIPKLAIFSRYDIKPHSEITFNYGSGTKTPHSAINMKACLCNAENCTGWLPFDVN